MQDTTTGGENWSWSCHLDYGDSGSVTAVRHQDGATETRSLTAAPAGGQEPARRPVLLGVEASAEAIVLDPVEGSLSRQGAFPGDGTYAYAYRDSAGGRLWFMNDGDKETGNDTLHCGDRGASVTIVNTGAQAGVEKILCVGRGHHVTTFVGPTAQMPDLPRRAFVSNLMDGSISVVGNDPADAATFLQVIDTINLCEPEKEDDGQAKIPNNAFPHGMQFSPVTGRLYNLNNGYKTVAVIDPRTNTIEKRIPLAVSSNLLLSPDGRFLIGKGADRKDDPDHVIGRLSVIDVEKGEVVQTLDLPDVYPSTYRFSPGGDKLYVTTATTGKGTQRDNLIKDTLYVYDTSALPALKPAKAIKVGLAECGRRPIGYVADGDRVSRVFVPNPTDGTVSVLNGADEAVLETVTVGEPNVAEFSFLFWDEQLSAC